MEEKFEIVKADGYDNHMDWNYTIHFNYNGNPFTYLSSGNAFLLQRHREILQGHIGLEEEVIFNEKFLERVYESTTLKESLINAAKKLITSGEEKLELPKEEWE